MEISDEFHFKKKHGNFIGIPNCLFTNDPCTNPIFKKKSTTKTSAFKRNHPAPQCYAALPTKVARQLLYNRPQYTPPLPKPTVADAAWW